LAQEALKASVEILAHRVQRASKDQLALLAKMDLTELLAQRVNAG
jgi:hypothetical protein